MAETLLRTKLLVPPVRPNLVPRPRLVEQLNQGQALGHILSLISAPAGFGKSTLASEWVTGRAGPVAWLTLDEGDNDGSRFLIYFVAALQNAQPDVGEAAVALLNSPQPPATEAVITALINDLAESDPGTHILVLDDYHLVSNTAVHKGIAYLLENMPPALRLVIVTRADPPLPLARWRARGQMSELRQMDLRFTAGEAAAFLNEVMGLALTAGQVEMLEDRTEGWIAGLQMAALSISGRHDRADFIAAFSGSHRFILDYLTEEVIRGLPDDLQQFLMQTSILGRLRGSLCDAVTGQERGWATLEKLEAANLFLIPLDEERIWFRYHHLFAEVISKRLSRRFRDKIPALHLRAAHWFRQNGLFDEAISHALAAGDVSLAADVVESQGDELLRLGRLSVLVSWLGKLAPEVVEARPQLGVTAAWVDLLTGKLDRIDGYLTAAEQNLDNAERPNDLPGQIAAIRFYAAALAGDLGRAMDQAQVALGQLARDNHTVRGVVALVLGSIYSFLQDYPQALANLREAADLGHQAGSIHVTVGALSTMGDALRSQGDLAEAERVYNRALQLGTGRRGRPLPVSAGVYAGLAELRLAQKDFVSARQLADTGLELGERWLNAESQIVSLLALAKIEHLEGHQDAAAQSVKRARRLAASHQVPPPRIAQIVACEQAIARAPDDRSDQGLLAPLTGRELEILGLFAAGLSNREIADKLTISPGTVKAHSSNIYRKLDARNRAQAIIRAGELNLL